MSMKMKVRQAVTEIYLAQGHVRASELVEAARPVESTIHGAFEWDDAIAGHEYRLSQARQWIRRVEIIIDDRPEVLVHVPILKGRPAEGLYRPLSIVARNPKEREAHREEALRHLAAAKRAVALIENAVADIEAPPFDFHKVSVGFGFVEAGLNAEA